MDKKYALSFSPHIRDNSSVSRIMLDVIIALIPTTIVGIIYFGIEAAITIVACIASAVATEYVVQKFTKKPVTIGDYSAVLTGLLLALNLPSGVPIYIPVVGGVFAIAIAKQCFGGLGNNFVNPALVSRVFLMMSWPVAMTAFTVDGVATATPLALMKAGSDVSALPSLGDMFIGHIGGCIGEVSALALLIGAAYLVYRKVIDLRIPVSFIATTAVFTWIFDGTALLPYHLLGGGLLIGAFFMATDYVTSPVCPKARIAFGIGCGLITSIIRLFGGYPEGVSFSILIMNLCTPLLERAFTPKIYGEVKEAKAK